ncbi:outer membrane lipoprotein carrier protein LolA [bacterium]|nr:outer membrane lipoprotein carrier protein LolA [bacterium]
MKKISIIIFLFFIAFPAFADVYNSPSSLENISKQIPKMGSIKCNFRQEKYLKNIEKPLVSSGDFEFAEKNGVYFYTKYPVQSKVDYTNKNYKQINDVVNAVSSKKYSRLEKEFNFYYEGNSDKWTLGMKPKENSNAYNYVSSITIDGTDYINKISILQTNGNKTVLWFTK